MELQISASRQVNTAKHNLTTLTQTTKDNEHIDVDLLFECKDSSSWPYQQQQHVFYFAVFGLVTCARNIAVLQLNFRVLGWFNLLAALGITEWLATWVRQLYQGNCLQGKNPRQSPALDL